MHLLQTVLATDPSSHFQDLFSRCLLCGACADVCPRDLPIVQLTTGARERFARFAGQHGLQKYAVRKVLAHPDLLDFLTAAGVTLQQLNLLPSDSGLRLRLGLFENAKKQTLEKEALGRPRSKEQNNGISYFIGCLARHLQPAVADATKCLTGELTGEDPLQPTAQRCCGMAALAAGKRAEAVQLAKENIRAFPGTGPILTSCASCSSHLKGYPELFSNSPLWQAKALAFSERVVEFGSFFLGLCREEESAGGKEQVRVHYHEPCHLRFATEGQGPRLLLKKIADLELVPASPHCCGQGGLFQIGYPELSSRIFAACAAKALGGKSVDLVTTTCSGCLMQWQQGMTGVKDGPKVQHMALLLIEKLKRARNHG
jgi:glycolate oxidase iron-sulfur subunit